MDESEEFKNKVEAATISGYSVEGRIDGYYVIDQSGGSKVLFGPVDDWHAAFKWLEDKIGGMPAPEKAITSHILRNL